MLLRGVWYSWVPGPRAIWQNQRCTKLLPAAVKNNAFRACQTTHPLGIQDACQVFSRGFGIMVERIKKWIGTPPRTRQTTGLPSFRRTQLWWKFEEYFGARGRRRKLAGKVWIRGQCLWVEKRQQKLNKFAHRCHNNVSFRQAGGGRLYWSAKYGYIGGFGEERMHLV